MMPYYLFILLGVYDAAIDLFELAKDRIGKLLRHEVILMLMI